MGKLISGDELAGWIGLSRRLDCSLLTVKPADFVCPLASMAVAGTAGTAPAF